VLLMFVIKFSFLLVQDLHYFFSVCAINEFRLEFQKRLCCLCYYALNYIKIKIFKTLFKKPYGEMPVEDIGFWVIIYIVLGLLAFIRPWFIHEVKKLLSFIDVFTVLIVFLSIYNLALNLQVMEVTKQVCLFVQDSVIGAGLPFIYLMAANISRAIQFEEFSERTLTRITTYLFLALMLFAIGMKIQC